MKISSAKFENGNLVLQADSMDARRFVFNFKAGEYDIVKAKKKRSLDANAYCWVLCTEIAKAVGVSKETVYRRAISDGNHYVPMEVKPEAMESFARIWAGKGLGWVVEIVDETMDGKLLVFAYYGSSAYDRTAMSRLIDSLVQEAKNVGVETLSERELSLLKEGWHG